MSVPADRSPLQVKEGQAPTCVRSCSASSSGTSAEGLTDDLLLEILSCVPARSLCHFRCVSKHWRSLIDPPDLHKKLPRTFELPFCYSEETIFVNSRLHFHVSGYDGVYPTKGIAAVHTEVGTWTNFGVPAHDNGIGALIQWSQGRMHYINFFRDEGNIRLKVYVLQNYESKEWALKHNAEPFYIFGELEANFKWDLEWVGIHPESNLIFFTRGDGQDTKLMCYYMDFEQAKEVCSLKDGKPPYLPYVPLYAEVQSLHM